MPDGTVYAGMSPDTGKAMYATPADAPQTHTFNQARVIAKNLDAHGYKDWRVPTKGKLNVPFQNRDAIGGFNETGPYLTHWYWSSSHRIILIAWARRFSDGHQLYHASTSTRLYVVCTEPLTETGRKTRDKVWR